MKIIDLLNTPLDKLPKKIKVEDKIYTLYINEANQHYYQDDKCKYFLFSICCFDELNNEVEIIEEEKKIPEKIDLAWQNSFDEQVQQDCIKMIIKNINEIIDYLQSKEDE